MKFGLEVLVRIAWVVVAIAAVAPFILSRLQGDGALLRFLRSRSGRIRPIDRQELRHEIGAGIRVTLFLILPVVIYAAFFVDGNKGWWPVIILTGAVYVPLATIPFSLVHTVLAHFLAFRGPVVSVALGIVLATIASRMAGIQDSAKPLVIYGGGYGLIVTVRHVMLTSSGIVPDEGTPLAEEAAKELS